MTTRLLRVRRDALPAGAIPDAAQVGDWVTVDMFDHPVAEGRPGLITELGDWIEIRWDAQ